MRSKRVIGRRKHFEKTYINPDFFNGAGSFSFKNRKMLVYADGCGNNTVPPEWQDAGVMIYAEFMGESFSRGHIRYECRTKDNQTVRL